ncbi:hypothetical protein N9Z58_00520, partial [bacterium]|nr:hypothetical protein [bacterium]
SSRVTGTLWYAGFHISRLFEIGGILQKNKIKCPSNQFIIGLIRRQCVYVIDGLFEKANFDEL